VVQTLAPSPTPQACELYALDDGTGGSDGVSNVAQSHLRRAADPDKGHKQSYHCRWKALERVGREHGPQKKSAMPSGWPCSPPYVSLRDSRARAEVVTPNFANIRPLPVKGRGGRRRVGGHGEKIAAALKAAGMELTNGKHLQTKRLPLWPNRQHRGRGRRRRQGRDSEGRYIAFRRWYAGQFFGRPNCRRECRRAPP
jgi:hypothetical protein